MYINSETIEKRIFKDYSPGEGDLVDKPKP
jgi:hypothetical protein